jgi:hypothetical protein
MSLSTGLGEGLGLLVELVGATRRQGPVDRRPMATGAQLVESPLEVVGRDAERAQRVPHSECHAQDTEGRHDAMEGALHER